jgi:hypothetical protein
MDVTDESDDAFSENGSVYKLEALFDFLPS